MQDWKSWIAQRKVKAIMGWPINADAMIPVTRQAQDAGIPVIGYAVHWRGISAAMLTNPEKDGRSIAEYAVNWVTENIGADAAVENLRAQRRAERPDRAARQGHLRGRQGRPAERHGLQGTPRSRAKTATPRPSSSSPRTPDTTIWLSFSNDNMKGVYKALTDAGVAPDDPRYFLAGMDVTNEDLDLISAAEQHLPDGLRLPQRDAR